MPRRELRLDVRDFTPVACPCGHGPREMQLKVVWTTNKPQLADLGFQSGAGNENRTRALGLGSDSAWTVVWQLTCGDGVRLRRCTGLLVPLVALVVRSCRHAVGTASNDVGRSACVNGLRARRRCLRGPTRRPFVSAEPFRRGTPPGVRAASIWQQRTGGFPGSSPSAARRRSGYGTRPRVQAEPALPADWLAARRYSALMRCASSSWSSRMTMRHAASIGVPLSTSSRARAAIRSW